MNTQLKTKLSVLAWVVVLLLSSCSTPKPDFSMRDQNFDSDWKFNRGDASGADNPSFDDSKWRSLDLPHDWSIEDVAPVVGKKQIGPFSEDSQGKGATGHVVGGIGWYRKSFVTEPSMEGKKVQILFDGVYMNSEVWINGQSLGVHPYGYTPFYYDLTPLLNPVGKKNTLAVRVNNNGKNSRWYSGSGIYRHVNLIVTDKIYIPVWGISVSTPEVSKEKAIVKLNINVANETDMSGKLTVATKIVSPGNPEEVKAISTIDPFSGESGGAEQSIEIGHPALWSPESPALYQAITEVSFNGKVVDQQTTTFGIRSIAYSADKGFLLNGEPIELKGGCMHHDNGPLGSATIDRGEERRVELMKKFGYNAIRTSHNPPSRQFLDACDRLGVLVIDEAFDQWQRPKNPEDYNLYFDKWHKQDLESMILRDRNHPSVVFWSIGNEINERVDPSGLEIMKNLISIVKNIDTTRPITEAICFFWDHPTYKWESTVPAFAQLDVGGYNYQLGEYEKDHQIAPERLMMGTESFPLQAFENWQMVEKHPYVIGDFVWTAMDYLGESGIGHSSIKKDSKDTFSMDWPWYNAYCGDIDICGFKKPQSYYRDVVWKVSNLEMAVHSPIPAGMREVVSMWGWPDEHQSWNWAGSEGQKLQVNVYSNYPEVRLELNGKVIGTKPISVETKLTTTFEVPYEAGELKAIALKDGKEVGTKILKTTGKPAKLKLTADRSELKASRNDLSYVKVEVVDENGNLVPNANLPIQFKVEGAGELAAVENGNPADMKSFRAPRLTTFNGRGLVILRPTGNVGEIKLTAESANMGSDKITVTTK